MERLVNDLLLLSRGEIEIARQPVYLGVLFQEILDELEPIASERHISLKLSGDIELSVAGDPVLLYKMVANLVENGICYNRPGGSVEMNAQMAKDGLLIAIRVMAWAWTASSRRACSNGSPEILLRPVIMAAAGDWAWRLPPISPGCTAAKSASKAHPAREASSG